jgi:hypothetical protein
MAGYLRFFLPAFVLGFLYTVPLQAVECTGDLASYNGYRVRQVLILTPIQFFSASTFGFDQLKLRLPLRENQPFSLHDLSEGQVLIKEYVKALGADVSEKFKFVIVIGRPKDCDTSARTLSVAYRVFTNIYRPYLSYTFEERTTEVQRPSAASGEGGAQGRFLVRPLAGYNRARRGYGGLDLYSTIPVAGFQSAELHPSFSSNSMVGEAAVVGSWKPGLKGLEHAGLRLGFHYSDEPAGAAKLKEGKLTAQFFAATQPLAKGDAILRYGASLEGGHQQTSGVVPQSALVAANSGYGALKFYLGTTGRAGRHVFTASYGAEAGSTFQGRGVDFVKHVADLGYTARFLRVPKDNEIAPLSGKVHKPWDLEFRASAGAIQSLGAVPAAERFFGGNQVQSFIDSDSWVVPGGAYIRSIPQNRLGGLGPTGALGGTRFYSGNFTIAKVLWGRPLVPKELAEDAQFVPVLNGAMETARGTISDYYKVQDPAAVAAYKAAASELDPIADAAQQTAGKISALPAAVTGDGAVASSLRFIRSKLRVIHQIIGAIKAGDNNTQFSALVNVQMTALEKEMDNLAQILVAKGQPQTAASISTLRNSMETFRNNIQDDLAKVNGKAAQDRANQDFSAAQRVLKAFLYELNIYSIAPIAVFDVARVWPTGISSRYAVGGGVRLSLVNMNLTVAYAANPKRNPDEGRGAIFVKLDVEDLFH